MRRALVPRLADDADSDLAKFSTPADGFGALGSPASSEAPISVTTLKPSALEKIQEFLVRGERRQACHYALDEKLWAHAMVIASSLDRDVWQEVVKEFIRAELGSMGVKDDKTRPNNPRQGLLPTPTLDGHESLKVAYSLFAGQGAASGINIRPTPWITPDPYLNLVQAMLPPAPLSRTVNNNLVPPPPTPLGVTPVSPNFPGNVPKNVPAEVLAKWAETIAMMISNSASPETSAALTTLGDHLSVNQWIEAAHAWYGSNSCIHLYCGPLYTRFQLSTIPANISDRRPWISNNPFGPRGVCQSSYHPDLQQGSRFCGSFRDCGVCLLAFSTTKRTRTVSWISPLTAVQVDSSPPAGRVGTRPARNKVRRIDCTTSTRS